VPLSERASATGGGESPPLAAFEVALIPPTATLGRSRLKAVIICGIGHPPSLPPSSPYPLSDSLTAVDVKDRPCFLLPFVPLLSFSRQCCILESSLRSVSLLPFFPSPPPLSLSLRLPFVSLSARLFLFKLRIPRIPLGFYLNVICILSARPFDSSLIPSRLLLLSLHLCARP